VRGEGEEDEMGEEKQSSHDPLYTNKHSTLATEYELSLFMPHRAYYDYDHSRNDDEIMYSALTEPSPCRCVRIVHGRSCPDDLGPRNSPEVIPGDRWAKAKMHNIRG
jgi:hypothetical protein